MADISVATSEQSDGIAQVNQALAQMDGVTQQNAALVEEAAAAAESLQDQAHHLAEVIGVFKLGEQARQPAPASRKVPAKQLANVKAAASKTKSGDDWEAF
jgi:methyl-accepting chemotaxis protein